MEQVFLNLLINASHAMPTGGTLTVRTSYSSDDQGRQGVAVEVVDTGTGIEPANLPHIFDPFFTTKGRLGQSDVPGTGLGLSVTHGIVSALGRAQRLQHCRDRFRPRPQLHRHLEGLA